jgi:CheY-like chemotaxis protein
MLKLMANDVRTAHSGLEALSAAESFRPELVLMDVGMPVMDGYATTRRIREQPWGKRIAVYALTGWGQEADRLKSQDAGCNGHLVKPVNFRDLEKVLADLPSRSGPERAQ